MGLVEPLPAFVVSFLFLGVMVYKRVGLGIALTFTAMLLSLLSLDPSSVGNVFWKTLTNFDTVSLVLATSEIMLLTLLYKETGFITILSKSLSEILQNSKLVVSVLPAVVGLLPVPGGALMSAPVVEAEASKLVLKKTRQTYVNLWFRHTIFPVYPVSQFLILTATLTGLSVIPLVVRQVPVVIVMVAVGYAIGFWKVSTTNHEAAKNSLATNLASLLKALAPLLVTIIAVVALNINISLAGLVGVFFLLFIAKPSQDALLRSLKNRALYEVTLAALGAMLLKNVTETSGISLALGRLITGGGVNDVVLLSALPAILALLLGSPIAGVTMSVSMLPGTLVFSPEGASLLFMTTYLGYLGAPTHLCLVLTADYFRSPLGGVYRYLIPSLIVSFLAAILVYFLL